MKLHRMGRNPVREAIVFHQERKMGSLQVLIEELTTLERFQPRHPNINVAIASSFDFFLQKEYRPKENIEHIYQLTALAFIMTLDRRISSYILSSPFFKKPLLSDIKYCLSQVSRIDPDYLRLVFRFT